VIKPVVRGPRLTILICVTRGVLERARLEVRESPAAPAGVVALAVILLWSGKDGGSDPLLWAPGSLVLVALLVVVAVAAPGAPAGGRAGIVALAAFAAFVAWCYLSIAWSDVRADAWSGANKTLAFFAIYALFAIRPWRTRPAAGLLGAYSLGITVIGLWEVLSLARLDDPSRGFIEGRLAEPISYSNANCALYLCAAMPALFLGSRREVPDFLRGAFLASAGVLGELALLCQSRMSVLALPLVLAAYLVVIPNRLRSLVALTVVATVTVLAGSWLLDVYEAISSGAEEHQTVVGARNAMLVTAFVLFVAGLVWSLVDRRLVVPVRVTRWAGVTVAALGIVLVLAGSAAFAHRYGSPVHQVGVWWGNFKGNEYVSSPDTPHLVSGFGGAGRYDIWRVAGDIFADHPVVGIGVDNFSVDFLRERTIDDNPLYPHSVELRLLQQTGLVGTGLFAAFLGAVAVAGWGSLRRGPSARRGLAGAALLVFVYWLVHGSIDWLWEIPALSAAAFAALGLFVALSPRASRPWPRWATIGSAAAVGSVALVSIGSAWLSARDVDSALGSWRASPESAYEFLDRARTFDPFSDQPDVLGAVIAAQLGDVGRQRTLLERALTRNSHNWYPYLELGLLDSRAGRRAEGLQRLQRAHDLNPLDEAIRFAIAGVRKGDPPTQQEMDALFVRSAELLTGVRQ
jgi:hypothetical protein